MDAEPIESDQLSRDFDQAGVAVKHTRTGHRAARSDRSRARRAVGRARGRSEAGVTTIMAALLVPVVLGVGTLALGATTTYVAKQDARRAVDLGAVAAAANAPSASVSGSAVTSPFDVDGVTTTLGLSSAFTRSDWAQTACEVTQRQLDGDRSRVLQSFRDADLEPSCTTTWGWENPVTGALASCAADVEIVGCRTTLDTQLTAGLPALDDSSVDALEAAADALATGINAVSGQADSYVDDTLLGLLAQSCLGPIVLGVCTIPNPLPDLCSTLWADAGISCVGGDPQLGFDLAELTPALATPQVRVTMRNLHINPPLAPMGWGQTNADSTAVARRTIKSALVLPSLGIPGIDPADGAAFATEYAARLGLSAPDAETVGEAAGTDGFVVDPNDLNPGLDALLTDAFTVLNTLEDTVKGPVQSALETTVCASGSVTCPDVSDPLAPERLVAPFLADLANATDAPPSGSAPAVEDVLAEFAVSGDPILMVGTLERVSADLLEGSAVWNILQTAIPGLGDVLFIPALDVVPAIVRQPVAGGPYVIDRIPNTTASALATSGLYRGRLVE